MGKYDYLIEDKEEKTSPTSGKYDYLIKQETSTTTPQKKTSIKKRGGVLGGLQELVGDVSGVVSSPFPEQSFNPLEALKTGRDVIKETIADAGDRYARAIETIRDRDKSVLQKAVAIGEADMGLIHALFLPITAPLQGAAKLPVVGSAVEIINRFFGVLGVVGEDALEGYVEYLPIPDKTKKEITPLAKEVGALAAQIVGGKAVHTKVKEFRQKSRALAEEIDRGVVEQNAPPAPPEAPQKATEISRPGEPVTRQITQPAKTGEAVQVPNTRAQTLEKAAVEKKLTDSLGELPTHERMNMVDQASRATDFVEKSPNQAMRIVRGEVPPKGILPEAIYTALEIKAIRGGDVAMLRELAKSDVPTAAGQALKALDSADPNSPVAIMRDVQRFREAKIEKKTGKKRAQTVKDEALDIMREVKKSSSKRPTWEEFIKEITCK